jgi:ribosome biogenesis GTPase
MAKRKLSGQQLQRIQRSQRASAARVDSAAESDDRELGAEQPGLVIAHYGRQVEVEALAGPTAGRIHRCHLRTNLTVLVTGDRVVWRPELKADGDGQRATGVVVAGLERRSLLARPDSHAGVPKPVAANIDYIAIVIAAEPEPFANLIDRYLVAAEATGITPLLVLNKTDLLHAGNQPRIDALLAGYTAIGYRVLRAAARQQHGLDQLQTVLRDATGVFVGQSGVGKSSLIGALLPGLDIRVGALSQGEAKGRHTTTTARLFHLPGGGDLIDSPGIREFGLGHLSPAEIEQGFIEFRPWLGRCRFRDCRHRLEPGCALLEAAAAGHISAARMHSYRAIRDNAGNG